MAPDCSKDLCVFRLKAEPWKLNVCYGSTEQGGGVWDGLYPPTQAHDGGG